MPLMLILLVSLLLAPVLVLAGEGDAPVKQCSGVWDSCGLVARDGSVVVPAIYEDVRDFHDGRAAVRQHGKWGFVDRRGTEVIAPEFDRVGRFLKGHAEVMIGNRAGLVDRSGNLFMPDDALRAVPISASAYLGFSARGGHSGDPSGFQSTELRGVGSGLGANLQGASSWSRKFWYLARIGGGKLTPLPGAERRDGYMFRLADLDGGGLIWAMEPGGNGRWGLMNDQGEWVDQPRWSMVRAFSKEGIAVVGKDWRGDDFVVTRDGTTIVEDSDWSLLSLKHGHGIAIASRWDGKSRRIQSAILNSRGEVVGGHWFDKVQRGTGKGFPRGLKGHIWYSISPAGKLARLKPDAFGIDCQSFHILKRDRQDLDIAALLPGGDKCKIPYRVHVDGGEGMSGKAVVLPGGHLVPSSPPYFEAMSPFINGQAVVKLNGRWGLIDKQGEYLITPRFKRLEATLYGLWRATTDYGTVTIDHAGQLRPIHSHYASLHPRDHWLNCKAGSRLFRRDEKWGLMGAEGQVIIKPEYRALMCPESGLAWVSDPDKGWCPLAADGSRPEAVACRAVRNSVGGLLVRQAQLHDDPHESSVLWHLALLDYARGDRHAPPRLCGHGFQPFPKCR